MAGAMLSGMVAEPIESSSFTVAWTEYCPAVVGVPEMVMEVPIGPLGPLTTEIPGGSPLTLQKEKLLPLLLIGALYWTPTVPFGREDVVTMRRCPQAAGPSRSAIANVRIGVTGMLIFYTSRLDHNR